MREYQTVKTIKANNPGVQAWIIQGPAGPSFILRPRDPEPEGLFSLQGVIE